MTVLHPEEILRTSPEQADELLERLEADVPVVPTLLEIPTGELREAIVFGDTHGDWRSTSAVAARFLDAPGQRMLIGLGDYIDRAPDDCGEGSVANALYLLQLAAEFPGRVNLLQGNHETTRRIAVVPHDLPQEVDLLWGPDEEQYRRLIGLLERGPLAIATTGGAFLAHAGFPRIAADVEWKTGFEQIDDDRLAELVWMECSDSRSRRGAVAPFKAPELERFLARSGCSFMLRGHDPDLNGRPLYHGRCLTLHTTRIYERFGGVLIARLPLDRPVPSAEGLLLEHVETEGKTFDPPG